MCIRDRVGTSRSGRHAAGPTCDDCCSGGARPPTADQQNAFGQPQGHFGQLEALVRHCTHLKVQKAPDDL
eukprot:7881035-Alexandrium_andersonii.AAC.1